MTTYQISAQFHGGQLDGQLLTLPAPFCALEIAAPQGSTEAYRDRYELDGSSGGIWQYRQVERITAR